MQTSRITSINKHMHVRVVNSSRLCAHTYTFFYMGPMEKLTSPKDKFERGGNGDLPGLLAGVTDKSKACLNCHSVFILRVCRVGD